MAHQDVVNVLIADDHPVVRQGLADLINRQRDMSVCAQTSGDTDLVALNRRHRPDVVVIDLSLGTTNGLELTRLLLVDEPATRVLILSMHDETLYAERALHAGAAGYVMKREAVGELLSAIRHVASGASYLSPTMSQRIVEAAAGRVVEPGHQSPMERLTDRERDVFELIGRGLGTREIALRLCRSIKTVETHRAHIKDKLGLRTGPELVRSAVSWLEAV